MSVSLSENIYMGTATPSSGGGTVDQTYDQTSANAQSGVAVSEAVAGVLPSQTGNTGKFLTTDGTDASWETITIPSIDIDGATVTKNASDELQASAVMNARTGTDVLPIWQGTEQQWIEGVGTDWYNWKTNVSTVKDDFTMPNYNYKNNTYQVAYGNGGIVTANSYVSYQTEDFETWTVNSFGGGSNKSTQVNYGNGVYIATSEQVGYNYYIYRSVNGKSWSSMYSPISGPSYPTYGNGVWVIKRTYGTYDIYEYAYSTNDGQTWTSASFNNGVWKNIKFLNGKFIIYGTINDENKIQTSVDGVNWELSDISFNATCLVYGSNKYICPIPNESKVMVSTDFISWTEYPLPYSDNWHWNSLYEDGKFVIYSQDESNKILVSENGIDWYQGTLTTSTYHNACCGDGKFYFFSNGSDIGDVVTFSQGSVYTLSTTPATSSTVYSTPNTASALTITSVGEGTITLSDNNTYTYTQSDDEVTYQSIGEAHPTWLCNVNGVGVKVGTTVVADNTDTSTLQTKANLVTSVSSSSTDSQYPSAKLFYDTCGDIETLINNL